MGFCDVNRHNYLNSLDTLVAYHEDKVSIYYDDNYKSGTMSEIVLRGFIG